MVPTAIPEGSLWTNYIAFNQGFVSDSFFSPSKVWPLAS